MLPTGGISITWQLPPGSSTQFLSYTIYTSPVQGGPYTLQTTIPTYNTNSYTCNAITNANTQP
ncbi:MAG TPA: hypothetical protein VN698_06095, partial [Bacteroidia bacterium]|nr:hypothetical protein [Bacteroidia bacterium]